MATFNLSALEAQADGALEARLVYTVSLSLSPPPLFFLSLSKRGGAVLSHVHKQVHTRVHTFTYIALKHTSLLSCSS